MLVAELSLEVAFVRLAIAKVLECCCEGQKWELARKLFCSLVSLKMTLLLPAVEGILIPLARENLRNYRIFFPYLI